MYLLTKKPRKGKSKLAALSTCATIGDKLYAIAYLNDKADDAWVDFDTLHAVNCNTFPKERSLMLKHHLLNDELNEQFIDLAEVYQQFTKADLAQITRLLADGGYVSNEDGALMSSTITGFNLASADAYYFANDGQFIICVMTRKIQGHECDIWKVFMSYDLYRSGHEWLAFPYICLEGHSKPPTKYVSPKIIEGVEAVATREVVTKKLIASCNSAITDDVRQILSKFTFDQLEKLSKVADVIVTYCSQLLAALKNGTEFDANENDIEAVQSIIDCMVELNETDRQEVMDLLGQININLVRISGLTAQHVTKMVLDPFKQNESFTSCTYLDTEGVVRSVTKLPFEDIFANLGSSFVDSLTTFLYMESNSALSARGMPTRLLSCFGRHTYGNCIVARAPMGGAIDPLAAVDLDGLTNGDLKFGDGQSEDTAIALPISVMSRWSRRAFFHCVFNEFNEVRVSIALPKNLQHIHERMVFFIYDDYVVAQEMSLPRDLRDDEDESSFSLSEIESVAASLRDQVNNI